MLAANGEIAVYVYRTKAPIREFVDDYVRDRIAGLEYGDAMAVCQQITEFGKALSEQGGRVRVPAVPVLGIEAAEYEVQRLLYHFFANCFWSDELSFEDNVVINYDRYHPQECTRHTPDEVCEWFQAAGLQIVHKVVDHYGITVRGRRPDSEGPALHG